MPPDPDFLHLPSSYLLLYSLHIWQEFSRWPKIKQNTKSTARLALKSELHPILHTQPPDRAKEEEAGSVKKN